MQFGLGRDHWVPFLCTPPFLAFIAPLALVPYPAAWLAWVVATYLLWLLVARRLMPEGFWPIAAFPGAMIAAWHAQNGLVTSALFIGAALTLETRPRLAGALLGALIIKPHLAVLVPIALLAGRRWTAFWAAAASGAGLLVLSLGLFGPETFEAYLFSSGLGPDLLHATEREVLLRMPTVYAAAGVIAGPKAAVAAQVVSSIGMAVTVWWVWSRGADSLGKWAVLAVSTALATPYLFHYDLALLIIPVCWLAREGMRTGFRPWEKVALAAFYWAPFLTRAFAEPLGMNLMSLVLLTFLWLTLTRMEAFEPETLDRGRRRHRL